ncbi:MAG: translocation/assembly module TamB domain-containing protein [Elainellaceae cyanobacterium]
MTKSPNLGQEPKPPKNKRQALVRVGAIAGTVCVLGAATGAWWLWQFVQEDLAPLVANSLSRQFQRTVDIGAIESVSLTQVTIGESTIPATNTDPDRVTVPSITVRFNPLEVLWNRSLSLDVTLNQPEAYIEQDEDGLWISTRLRESEETESLVKIQLNSLRFNDATLNLAPYIETEAAVPDIPEEVGIVPETEEGFQPEATASDRPITPIITFTAVDGTLRFRDENKRIGFAVSGQPQAGGNFRVEGEANLRQQQVALQVNGRDLLATEIGLLLPLPLKLQAGLLNADQLQVQLPIATGNTPTNQSKNPFLSQLFLNGTVRFREATARLEALPKPFSQATGALRFRDQQIQLVDVTGQYGTIRARAGGSLDFLEGYNLTVRAPQVPIADLLQTLDIDEATIPVELIGTVQGELRVTGAIDRPLVQGVAQNREAVQVDRLSFDRAITQFTITSEAVTFSDMVATPVSGGQMTGKGTIKFGEMGGLVFDVQADDLAGDAIARSYGLNRPDLAIGNVNATAQVFGSFADPSAIQTVVQWQAPQATYPGRGRVLLGGGLVRFQDTVLLVADGLVRGEGAIEQGQWQASMVGSGIALRQFAPDLRGLLSGNLQLSGNLVDLSPSAIRATGEVAFSEGVGLIENPLTASIRWVGDGIELLQAEAEGFNANGFIGITLAGNAPGVSDLDLNVQLQDYALANLPVSVADAVQVAGTADFSGQVTGTAAAPDVAGNLQLHNLVVNELSFEPVLTGNIRYGSTQGLNLDLTGYETDRIAVVLDRQNRPVSFFIQQNATIAEGRGQGDRLLASLQNFPLTALNLTPAAALGLSEVGGLLNGRFDMYLADLSNPRVTGEVAIVNPSLDYIEADALTAQFRYFDKVTVIEAGELRRGESRYLLSGIYNNANAAPQFQGKLVAAEGRVEDIFTALQWFELTDVSRGIARPVYDQAADITTTEIGLPNAPLITQLRRFSEIVALRDQQIAQRENAQILPALSTLQGGFTGEVDIAYSPQAGPSLDFKLGGENWVWGDYQVNQVIAQGKLENGILTLLPLLLQSDTSLLRFTGQVGGEEQSGQLIAENIPVEPLQELLRLPLDVQQGILNANAFLTGSVGNPQVIGEIMLTELMLNNATAPPFRTLFGYNDARLQVESRLDGDEDNAFQFTGSIPYRFPFMTARTDSNEFSLQLNVRNDGLALTSLFTDQVAWKGGEGDVQLAVDGTIDTPPDQPARVDLSATGTAVFEGAQFSAKALPEDITDVSGTVVFDNDRIQVETLTGQFSDGQVTAQGTLPLLFPLRVRNPEEEGPLTINLDNIALDLENLYDGGVEGQVVVLGTAVAPLITGDVTLQDGQILIPDTAQSGSTPPSFASGEPAAPGIVSPPQLEDFQVVLGKQLQVVKEPLLNFLVSGSLVINGTQDDLRPEGMVYVRSGQVNLFTTQFYLDRNYENTAEFIPNRGLDPVLDVQLVANVPEITRPPANTSPLTTSEIAETPAFGYGSLQTIRVQASVTGPASQIYNNLELSSSPRRSEAEIVALLGGSFINTLGQGEGTIALANLAGTTLLTGLQNVISSATGLTDFRLFPTNIISESENERTATLELAAELGFDVTQDLSVSVLQILTVEEPTRFGVRYRLNDEFTLRGSVDTDGNSQAIVEFNTRF